ncbi:hypothetical protein QMK33_19130 [Hymenobacter sp. H14-R3]|uniref:hypothetical protein n=1 Tax=Hymenobacter sp. H14-R3 TaxID=3046308 RepID=UPI0024BA18FF|nr:hypothetical protein [Hymenobacter sp. H14-R3]MDJ0367267.1 hypothetical protein [Hymenobacter sp. H14-R3]
MQVSYRADLNQIAGRWLRSVTEAELHAGYAAMRQAALHYGCGQWLVDSRRRVNLTLNSCDWVTNEFLPLVQQELAQPLRVCFLVLPDYLDSLPDSQQLTLTNGPVQFMRHLDEGTGNAWLAKRQEVMS